VSNAIYVPANMSFNATPQTAEPIMRVSPPARSWNIAMHAPTQRRAAFQSSVYASVSGSSPPRGKSSAWIVPNIRCIANQRARFAMTPSTAAVMALRAALVAGRRLSRSARGAPAIIQTSEGANVHQAAISAHRAASQNPPLDQPATKPTYSFTRTSGPGVVSARPSPSSIWPVVSQPSTSTACCLR